MSDIYHIITCSPGAGLCNQLFSIVTGILLAFSHSKHKVIINGFLDDYSMDKYTQISEIIDLDQMNTLVSKYGLRLIDRIGCDESLENENLYYTMGWPTQYNKGVFDDILSMIRFREFFITRSLAFTQKLDPSAKINVLHLRIEDDAIAFWCSYNKMTEDEFRKALGLRYISMITEHIDKSDTNLILSYSQDNAVLDFMKENGYTFLFTDKDPSLGREKNAIIDSLVAESCNKVMIGNMNLNTWTGSSFSYYVSKRLRDGVRCVCIDVNDLTIPTMIGITPL